LEEAVLAVLGGARVGLDGQDLLAYERGEEGLELGPGEPADRRQPLLRERLAKYCAVLEQAPLVGREAVQTGSDQRLECFRHLERLDRPHWPIHRALLYEQAAVEEHADGLDGV